MKVNKMLKILHQSSVTGDRGDTFPHGGVPEMKAAAWKREFYE